ncbi:hypothetical protein QFC22_003183 [Naganishia vaughanmartiniae]|uniref:Uncharacterized protein n=1 Tax=Naganishia vaughanmartiniae TaxID=1424756 RepID=A0ACC2X920_9TREE|nr:hypothetical protein QFC22_003183 [Naganishia vaughanmartiniae]
MQHQQGKTSDTCASLSVTSGSRDDEWETLPVTEEAHNDYLPHRAAFTRLTVPSNKGSMSLLQFGARLTGDRVAQPVVDPDDDDDTMESTEASPWTRFVSERDIGTGPTGESVYQRNLASGLGAPDSGDTAGLNPPGAVKEMDVDYEMITDPWIAPPAHVGDTAQGQVNKPSRPLPRKRVKLVDFETS